MFEVLKRHVFSGSGDGQLFETLKANLENDLPQETIEWKRSFGRASKNVALNAIFQTFEADSVTASSSMKSLMGQPVMHTFWTECSDVDSYKNSNKDEIMNWITTLKKCGVPHDWMVILVEAPDSRKSTANKLLPRASVVDKLRTDIGTKNADRCFSLLGK